MPTYHVSAQVVTLSSVSSLPEESSKRAKLYCNSNDSSRNYVPSSNLHGRVDPIRYLMLDNASSIPVISEEVVNAKRFTRRALKTSIDVGAVSHDSTITLTEIAVNPNNSLLPVFYIAPAGTMTILPTYVLSKWGLVTIILANEEGFIIQDKDGKKNGNKLDGAPERPAPFK